MALSNLSVPTPSGNQALLMPKLQNRFRVIMEFNEIDDSDFIRIVTTNVVSATRPTLNFPEVTLDTYNSKVYIPGKHEWQTVEIVIRDDVSSASIRAIEVQLNQQLDMATQSAPKSAGSFKFDTRIDVLDGSNAGSSPIPLTEGAAEGPVLDSWKLEGCFIQNVAYGNNDYSSSEPVTLTVTLRYDNAIHALPGDEDGLSGAQVPDSVITSVP
jgi:hypothetical protein